MNGSFIDRSLFAEARMILASRIARQRPSLAGGNPQLHSALRSLTAVFGMGTGVAFLPSPPHNILFLVSEN